MNPRASVLDCASPLALWVPRRGRKRQRTAAVQNLAAFVHLPWLDTLTGEALRLVAKDQVPCGQ